MPVTYSQEGAVGVITMDRPPANSYDLPFTQEFAAAVDAALEGAVGAVIVQSASEKFLRRR